MSKIIASVSVLLCVLLMSACAGDDAALRGQLDGLNDELAKCRQAHQADQKRMAELEASSRQVDALLKRRTALYEDLTERLKDQLEAGNLKLTFRDGLMILEMPNKILFDSGSFKLKPQGKQTVEAIAKALGRIKDRRFLVAGHTDNVPIKQKSEALASNWDLSARRGLEVLNALLAGGVSPKMASVAGFGEHSPVASNSTDEGKAQNRRIEIILLPDLKTLLKPVR